MKGMGRHRRWGNFGGLSFFRRCRLKLCANVWWIFAWAAFGLFLYVLIAPSCWLMIILFMLVCGLILWGRAW